MKKSLKKAQRHIYSSGLAGCGGKAEPTPTATDPLPCPYCDRVYTRATNGRLKDHIRKSHPNGNEADGGDEPAVANPGTATGVAPAVGQASTASVPGAQGGAPPPRVPGIPASGDAGSTSSQSGSTYHVKTPKQFLQEWCQKNKRPAPKYKQVAVDGGFQARVVLPNTRDGSQDVILWSRGAEASAAQAEQRAAVLGLHHVMGDRRMDRLLSADFRQQWLELDEAATQRVAAAERQQQRQKAADMARARRQEHASREVKSVFMSEQNRRAVEGLLGSMEGVKQPGSDSSGQVLDLEDLRAGLERQGFQGSAVDLAVEAGASSMEEALDWLLLNAPEEALPDHYAPEASKSHVPVLGWRRSRLVSCSWAALSDAELVEARESAAEELQSLEAIWGEQLQLFEDGVRWRISLPLPEGLPSDGALALELHCVPGYPLRPPGIRVLGRGRGLTGPLLEGVAEALAEEARELAGAAMAFSLARGAGEEAVRLWQQPARGLPQPAQAQEPPPAASALAPARPPAAPRRPQLAPRPPDAAAVRAESERLAAGWRVWQAAPQHAAMRATRAALPAAQHREILLASVRGAAVTLVVGATGCGKSTQVPQFLLEEAAESGRGAECSVIVTQPRRLAAVGLAERVAAERGERAGGVVGYAVRLERCASAATRLLFCTTGVLLRRLLSDPLLARVSHVVVDEVHERAAEADMLLLLLTRLLRRRRDSEGPPLRLLLMSATGDAEALSRYCRQRLEGAEVGLVQIPGRTFPVHTLFLEDALELTGMRLPRAHGGGAGAEVLWEEAASAASLEHYSEATRASLAHADEAALNLELVEAVVAAIFSSERTGGLLPVGPGAAEEGGAQPAGALLLFVAGTPQINRLQARLQRSRTVAAAVTSAGAEGVVVLPLHGGLSSADQRRALERPRRGLRKVVIATNVAETSITIDDVLYVVDTGRHKAAGFDPARGLASLEESWVPRSAAVQREGRAGRVRAGLCVRLFSRATWARMAERPLPEVLRVPLQSLCLQALALLLPEGGGDLVDELGQLPAPPPPDSVRAALASLQALQAVGPCGRVLTPLGQHLLRLPLDPRLGRMLLVGALLRCLGPAAALAGLLSGRSPLFAPSAQRAEAAAAHAALAGESRSDHVAMLAAFNGWRAARQAGGGEAERRFCATNFVLRDVLHTADGVRQQALAALAGLGFCPRDFEQQQPHPLDANAHNMRVVKAALCSGFYPQVVRVQHPAVRFVETEGGNVATDAEARELRFYSQAHGRVFLHPSSVNFSARRFDVPWMVFTELRKTSKVFVWESSMVPAYALLLFGGDLQVDAQKGLVTIDGWIKFEAPARIGVLIRELRARLDIVLEEKLRSPDLDLVSSPLGEALVRLLTSDGF